MSEGIPPPPPPADEPDAPKEEGALVPVISSESADSKKEGEPEATPLLDEHLVSDEEALRARAEWDKAKSEAEAEELRAKMKEKAKASGGGMGAGRIAAGLIGVPVGGVAISTAAGTGAYAASKVLGAHGFKHAAATNMAASHTLFKPIVMVGNFLGSIEAVTGMLFFAKKLPDIFEGILKFAGISSGKGGDHAPKKSRPAAASGGGGGGGHH